MKIIKSSQHFNAYYHDDSLLMQFIISDFFMTYSLSQRIMKLAEPLQSISLATEEIFPQISQTILTMLGTEHDNSRPWTSQWGMGSLSKLKRHCERLSSNTNNQNKTHVKLHKAIHRAWICCLNCHELVRSIQIETTHTSNIKSIPFQPFSRMLFSLNASLAIASKLLLKAAHQHSSHENISLFLNRHQEKLIAIYGIDSVAQLISKNTKSLNQSNPQNRLQNLISIHE